MMSSIGYAGRLRTGTAAGLARGLVRAAIEGSFLRSRLFWRVPAAGPHVALTFDDGPDPEQTPRILDLLAAHGACATFFVVGHCAARHPELVRRMAAEGHAVGNHTWSHARCRKLERSELERELAETDSLLRELVPGSRMPLFRPPFGELDAGSVFHLLRSGRRIVLWNRDSRDYRAAGPAEIAALGESMRARDLLLAHDRYPATVEALPLLLRHLARRGFGTVRLDRD